MLCKPYWSLRPKGKKWAPNYMFFIFVNVHLSSPPPKARTDTQAEGWLLPCGWAQGCCHPPWPLLPRLPASATSHLGKCHLLPATFCNSPCCPGRWSQSRLHGDEAGSGARGGTQVSRTQESPVLGCGFLLPSPPPYPQEWMERG